MQSVLLNSYWALDKVGATISLALVVVFILVWIFVMYKYLDTSDLND